MSGKRQAGVWRARAVLVKRGRSKRTWRRERLPEPMTPKELHAWVREHYGDKVAHYAEDVLWTPT